jgi:hypothetical protein
MVSSGNIVSKLLTEAAIRRPLVRVPQFACGFNIGRMTVPHYQYWGIEHAMSCVSGASLLPGGLYRKRWPDGERYFLYCEWTVLRRGSSPGYAHGRSLIPGEPTIPDRESRKKNGSSVYLRKSRLCLTRRFLSARYPLVIALR